MLLLLLVPGIQAMWLAVMLVGLGAPLQAQGKGQGKEQVKVVACNKLMLTGEVAAGQQWSASIGEGWVFKLVPIASSGRGYTGWDLVVDREQGTGKSSAGYPDAVLLATPPYGSLSEREMGTTFGLRAQDAIAWTPRHFHFLRSVHDLARARELFPVVTGSGTEVGHAAERGRATAELLEMVEGASAGEFSVLDAKLVAGTADPARFAEQWASHLRAVPHTLEQAGGVPGSGTSERGQLRWIRFSVALWMPVGWRIPNSSRFVPTKCAQ